MTLSCFVLSCISLASCFASCCLVLSWLYSVCLALHRLILLVCCLACPCLLLFVSNTSPRLLTVLLILFFLLFSEPVKGDWNLKFTITSFLTISLFRPGCQSVYLFVCLPACLSVTLPVLVCLAVCLYLSIISVGFKYQSSNSKLCFEIFVLSLSPTP